MAYRRTVNSWTAPSRTSSAPCASTWTRAPSLASSGSPFQMGAGARPSRRARPPRRPAPRPPRRWLPAAPCPPPLSYHSATLARVYATVGVTAAAPLNAQQGREWCALSLLLHCWSPTPCRLQHRTSRHRRMARRQSPGGLPKCVIAAAIAETLLIRGAREWEGVITTDPTTWPAYARRDLWGSLFVPGVRGSCRAAVDGSETLTLETVT